MRLILKLFVMMCLMSVGIFGQEMIRQVMVGPSENQTRVVIAFAQPLQDGYKMQSMIIDTNPVKKEKELPTLFQVDLTSTIRSLSTGEKKQKILVLRWKSEAEIELKCGGKWLKQENPGTALKTIIETTKAVTQSVPLNTKKQKDATLPREVEDKVTLILNSLETEDIACLRSLN